MSFIAVEDVEAVAQDLGVGTLDPRLARRNVVLQGVDLALLRHARFRLTQGDDVLDLQGGRETAPCDWMDLVLAPGARDALRGRGGLRARPLTSATLRIGPAVLDVVDA
jgi:MOSC domain-containing protein YiiM